MLDSKLGRSGRVASSSSRTNKGEDVISRTDSASASKLPIQQEQETRPTRTPANEDHKTDNTPPTTPTPYDNDSLTTPPSPAAIQKRVAPPSPSPSPSLSAIAMSPTTSAEPAAPEDRQALHLPPKSYADAAQVPPSPDNDIEIGRASCRERVF